MPDFSVILDNLPYFLWGRAFDGQPGGLLLTLIMSVEAGALALVAGVLLALLAWLAGGWTRRLLFAWADLIRGIPLIFVIFWLYFLVPAVFQVNLPDTLTVVLAIAWFTSAAVMYSTLAGLDALSRGQLEAGLSAGFSRGEVLAYILLPQAVPNVLPSLTGVLISLVKDTSLAFIVNVPELTTVAGQVNNRTQVHPTEIFIFTGAVYFLICGSLSGLAGALHRRLAPAR
ncbi:amino acid ABC transporter permease [Xanthobacter sp. V4C-4]|uniref:amino acid ABC transporter permease n=1 Tax=Xanthobacter cornucopiae TaxID=3119924 RepID=UPI0037296D47